ncbi:MAG TPA: VOC family protein [Bacteroidia bacterium]|nr:VOC family protein [Bacteroidia bacterium]
MLAWFEIPAFDFEKALDFYSGVFKFTIERKNFGSVPYGIMYESGTGVSGAIMKVKEPLVPNSGPVLFFKVTDMSETLLRIKHLGGEVIKEKSIIKNETPDGKTIIPKTMIDNAHGYYALFRDTEGNKMALYSNS